MVPFLAAAAAGGNGGNMMKKIGIGVGVAAVLIASYFIFKNVIKKAKYQEYEKMFGNDGADGLAVEFASRFYSAMRGMGTKELDLYAIADEMVVNGITFDLVANAYRNLYNDDLLNKIQKELDSSELLEFNVRLKGGKLTLIKPADNRSVDTKKASAYSNIIYNLVKGYTNSKDQETILMKIQEAQADGVLLSDLAQAYKINFGRDLKSDLKSELSKTQYNVVETLKGLV